jgi:dihydroorotate dehydrogenase electron transfer subunit
MRDARSRIASRKTYAPGLFAIECEADDLSRRIRAGQFAMIGVENRIQPYLRRAFSVADADPARGRVEFLVKTIGRGTACLESLPEGSELELLAPLGNRFGSDGLKAGDRVAIVAGGVGIAPFPLLLRELSRLQVTADLYFGGRTGSDLAYREKISGLVGGEEIDATEDGSAGFRGRVTEALARRLESGASYGRLFACGPMPMFAALAPVAARFGIAAEFSTEAPMGCGFGACLACVVPRAEGGYIVSCREGPILDPSRIDWSRR